MQSDEYHPLTKGYWHTIWSSNNFCMENWLYSVFKPQLLLAKKRLIFYLTEDFFILIGNLSGQHILFPNLISLHFYICFEKLVSQSSVGYILPISLENFHLCILHSYFSFLWMGWVHDVVKTAPLEIVPKVTRQGFNYISYLTDII